MKRDRGPRDPLGEGKNVDRSQIIIRDQTIMAQNASWGWSAERD